MAPAGLAESTGEMSTSAVYAGTFERVVHWTQCALMVSDITIGTVFIRRTIYRQCYLAYLAHSIVSWEMDRVRVVTKETFRQCNLGHGVESLCRTIRHGCTMRYKGIIRPAAQHRALVSTADREEQWWKESCSKRGCCQVSLGPFCACD